MPARELGRWSALIVTVVAVAYAAVLTVGMATHGASEPIGDPVLAVMEVLTFVSALPLVAVVAALHALAPRERRVFGVLALSFVVLFAGTTCAVHFIELTAGRQTGTHGIVWPSTAYAAELLAWDLFLGLALLSASAALPRDETAKNARRALAVAGALCVAGLVGPATGLMRLQLVGVVGYAVVLPVAAFSLARWFHAIPVAAPGDLG